MKVSNIGMVLLVSMVGTKYLLSWYGDLSSDLKANSAVHFNYSFLINENPLQRSIYLVAAEFSLEDRKNDFFQKRNSKNVTTNQFRSKNKTKATDELLAQLKSTDEPLPMEHRNSLVVFDLNHPENNLITKTFVDNHDEIPLDHSNTIVNGLMQIMPRKVD